MKKSLIIIMASLCGITARLSAEPGFRSEFSERDGNRIIRTLTGENQFSEKINRQKPPIRNPRILAQVVWVDRAHENAVAENVTITPDGSSIFVGWWLNNERFSSYVSAGLESPLWSYRQNNDWQMPVASSNSDFAGTGAGLPGYVWQKESPLYTRQFDFESGWFGRGVSFSGDGSLVAITAALGNTQAILIVYDLAADDTVFTREFTPTSGQYGVNMSDDGSRLVVSNYGNFMVYSVPEGELLATLNNGSQNTAKLSGDGSKLVTGNFQGRVYLYEWDGSQYALSWNHYTGHDWVMSLDISTDGSTAACGTLDFVNNQIDGGKFVMLDVPTGAVYIDYDEYGDAVGSVSLSGDGRYAIAGSWGQYGSTFGDVVTCFIRETDIPIFQLLDDIDEPGSIFNVSLSEAGGFAAAGGKAVHAREFGNGGMVYSIMIRDPLTNDVAVASIDEPGEFVNPGEDVIPTATFVNVGMELADFTAVCTITDIESGDQIYNSSFDVQNLGSFESTIVYFSPHFIMPEEGRYRINLEADMESDEDMSNNELALVLRSWHDVKANAAIAPFHQTTVNWPMSAVASFRNLGSYYETFDVEMSVYDSSENNVFSTISTIYGLGPYMEEEVVFEAWIPEVEGEYRAEFQALVEDDYFPDDNSLSKGFQVVREMIYDDGTAEVSIWVNAYPYAENRKFAQRFEPNIDPPFRITNARFYLGPSNYNGYFDYVGIASESGAFPDTSNFIAVVENPPLTGPGTWTSLDMDAPVDEGRPLWMVIHWPDREDSGPYIGADNTGIQERQSYWYADGQGWNQYAFYDWMMRMTLQEGQTGIEYDYYSGIPVKISLSQNYPNPFNPATTIAFALPDAGHGAIEIFNVLGERVRVVADRYFDAGHHSLVWDGLDDSGGETASGTYYYRLSSGDYRISRKMTLVR